MTAPLVDMAAVRRLVRGGGYDRGVAYFRSRAVRRLSWDAADGTLRGVVRGSSAQAYHCTIRIGPDGSVVAAHCSCPVQHNCKHTVATLLASNAAQAPAVAPAEPPGPAPRADDRTATASAGADAVTWRTLLQTPSARTGAPLALGLELRRRAPYHAADWAPRRVETALPHSARQGDLSLAARPLVRSDRTGSWIKGNASWDAVRRLGVGFDPAHTRWFAELATILLGGRGLGAFADPGEWLVLDGVESSLLWPHLRTAASAGVALVPTAARQSVALANEAVATIEVTPDGDDLRLYARVSIDGEQQQGVAIRAIGHGGVYAVGLDRDPLSIVLAPAALPDAVRALLPHDGVVVPAGERDAFLAEGLPRLVRRAHVTAAAGIALPEPAEPVAVVTAAFGDDDVRYRIEWSYPALARQPYPPGTLPDRDPEREHPIRAALEGAWAEASSSPFADAARLSGVDAAEFAARVLPAWSALANVRVEANAPRRAYTELTAEPEIRVTTVESSDPDWFDLGVVVTIEGRRIPFAALITALARAQKKLLLADGAYFSLAHPALERLKTLIAEASQSEEWQTEPRISRHQTDLWAEFEDLADESEAAVSWRALVEGLREADSVPPTPLPEVLEARLRPYQQSGFDWLAFLWRHRLGGILADDMGLGKTLQLLALAAHIRASGEHGPVLVIAPTSVLGTWAAEAARFAPSVAVRVIDATGRKRGVPVREAVAGADLVVTSYALARLDHEAYAEVRWSAVILDEAQFVKNARTKLHRAVATLSADAVYAATGTPMENGLSDLWALLSLTAPGLFPSARRFRDEYVKPIEQGKVPENEEGGEFRAARLARLRRRIRPLMLRRTKESVAPELPAKQELALRVSLEPAHRALYDRVLQRERQKVLGLLHDLDRNRFIVFRSLTLLRMMSLAPGLVDPAHAEVASSKLDALIERLVEVAAEGHRALVFSQFTSFLTLAAERLDAAGIAHAYLDGSTLRRAEVVKSFRSGTMPAFLISLKAGGFGLTLTEADYVFVLDPWWNPAAEAQAVDRAHRIGQRNTVLVYRLIAADTIEDKVLALQQRKARLFHAVIDDGELFSRDLTADDIRSLVGG